MAIRHIDRNLTIDSFTDTINHISEHLYEARYQPTPAVPWVPTEEKIQALIDNLSNATLRIDRFDFSQQLPSNVFVDDVLYLHFQYGDWTGVTSLPSVPVVNTTLRYLYFSTRWITARSMGTNNTTTVPNTYRNLQGLWRFYFQRQEFTSAQQVTLINNLEVEIVAGAGSLYTGTHYIYLNSTSSGANDPLVQADLEAFGWTIIDSNTMQKVIAGQTWRVEHNP